MTIHPVTTWIAGIIVLTLAVELAHRLRRRVPSWLPFLAAMGWTFAMLWWTLCVT